MKKPPFPNRKISETLIEFAQPILAIIDSQTTEERIRMGLSIAVGVWNVYVFDAANENDRFRQMLKQCVGSQWETNPLLRKLVERRTQLFRDDMRLIGDFKVRFDGSELRIWAEARDPFSNTGDQENPV